MSKIDNMNNKLTCKVYESQENLVASCSFRSHTKSIDNKKELNELTTLSKLEIEELLKEKQDIINSQTIFIKKAVESLTTDYIQLRNIKKELENIQHIKEIRKFLDENESNFNHIINNESNDETGYITITNGIYKLTITYKKRKVKYDIFLILSVHEIFSGNLCENPIASTNNAMCTDIEQVEIYINNKLKQYDYLFLLKKSILTEHVNLIHTRWIDELDIQVFKNKNEILSAVNQVTMNELLL